MKRFSFLVLFSFSFLFFSCEEDIDGCTNPDTVNYNPEATNDDGSCVIEGCMDLSACNYNSEATEEPLGVCNYPLESVLEITFSEDYVSGLVGEDVIAHIYLQNSSCETVSIKARKFFSDTEESSAYFCFAGVCFGSETTVSPTTLVLDSYESDDYFKGYFNSSVEGTFEVLYRFFLDTDPTIFVEKTITYDITSS